MRKHIAIIIASLALFTGQAHAQRCLPKMQGIELRANLVDGMRLSGTPNTVFFFTLSSNIKRLAFFLI